ncbi:PaaI family thioesterase [Novosphingobium sp. AP12]|uniref:PaaI family thioesterase n=1 Tax=Novosphingobium sp. AP12 TaxID=1144305 RepID=UPI0002EE9454|nr:PaaI family thioesterase [Novosphingobium sp. AP12]
MPDAVDAAALEAQGWVPTQASAFSAAIGPTWMRGEPGAREVALLTGEMAANDHLKVIHGGALMTFADIALGIVAVDAVGEPRCATAQLNYHFVRGVVVGALVTCRPQLVRRTRRLVFARGLFEVDGETVGSADGIFNVFDA